MSQKRKLFVLVLISFLVYACAPKTAQVVTAPTEPQKTFDQNNPCRKLDDLPPAMKEEAETAFAIYKDQMMIKRWESAKKIWNVAYNLAPGSNGSVTSHFSDGVTIYSELAKATTSPFLKQKYVDTIKMINAKYEECFKMDGVAMSRRAFDYYYTLDSLIPEQEKWNTFKKAIELNNNRLVYFNVNPFTGMLIDKLGNGTLSMEEGKKYADIIQKSIDEGVKNCKGQECESWEIVKSYAPDRLESLEGYDDFYDCTYYSNKYYPQYQADPDNCEIVNMVYSRLVRGKCDANDSRLLEVKAKRNAKCVEVQVAQASGPLKQAFDAYGEGNYRGAVQMFEEYIKTSTDDEKKAKYALLIAKIYYGDLKNFSQARKWAYEAAKYKKGWGEPFLLIGKLYASSGPLCGPGRGFASQVVTWPAIDKFAYARNIDPGVAAEANKLIGQYARYMPSTEDIFQRSVSKGSTYFVGCWIQESTTVRTAD